MFRSPSVGPEMVTTLPDGDIPNGVPGPQLLEYFQNLLLHRCVFVAQRDVPGTALLL